MVNSKERLARTFMALVDPTRRAILAQLERRDGASISELAKPFTIHLPAVMKHLDVLANAGLVTRSKSGRTVTVRLRAQPMREAMEWLGATNDSGRAASTGLRPMPRAKRPKHEGKADDESHSCTPH